MVLLYAQQSSDMIVAFASMLEVGNLSELTTFHDFKERYAHAEIYFVKFDSKVQLICVAVKSISLHDSIFTSD